MHKFARLIFILSSLLLAVTARAENWPSRLIKATIPFGAGSAADVVPRLGFDRLAAGTRQPIRVEKCGGGRGPPRKGPGGKGRPPGHKTIRPSSPPAIF